jgi:signal transduction histidine kinase
MKESRRRSLSRSVKEAIDSYPGGLCFSDSQGKPILVNKKMNSLVSALTGHTVINANIVWQELNSVENTNGCVRLNEPWLRTNNIVVDDNSLVFRLADNRIWTFRRQKLSGGEDAAVQTEAAEITELYHMSEELYENNLKLDALKKRQEILLDNIVEINREKELLAAKMKIHDDLGRCLVAAKQALSAENVSDGEYKKLLESWSAAIGNMRDVPMSDMSTSAEEELDKVAELIGCRIIYEGEKPKDRRTGLMMYSAVREALTNAVRHGGADEITVNVSYDEDMCTIMISNNGRSPEGEITEGGGLSDLRKSLEQEGAVLGYEYGDRFALVIRIP